MGEQGHDDRCGHMLKVGALLVAVGLAYVLVDTRRPACVGSGAFCGQPPALERNTSRGARELRTASNLALSATQIQQYERNGFVISRGLFTEEEAEALLQAASTDETVSKRAHGRKDAGGYTSKLSLWNVCGVNVYGAYSRAARLVDSVERLLSTSAHTGGSEGLEEAYHYHTKVMIKEPYVGGAWEWHQDYGYWYSNGNMFPRMLSAMVALNEHTEANGALHVLKGSHKMGRVTHTLTGDQAGADPDRIARAKAMFEDVPVLLKPGDVLFFHCNLFHASHRNTSPNPRWSIITAYNTRSNNPQWDHHHPRYQPLDRWSDTALLHLRGVGITDGDGTVFMKKEEDHSAQTEKNVVAPPS